MLRTWSRSVAGRAGLLGVSTLVLAGGTLAAATPAFADSLCSTAPTATWTGGGDGTSWTDPNNWDVAPSVTPSNVVIAPAAPATPGDPVALTINSVSGTVCGLKIDKSASPTSVVTVSLNGGLSIGADALTPTVELGGASLTLTGGTSQFAAGTTVVSTEAGAQQQPFGSFTIGAGETVQPAGPVSIGGTTTLHLLEGGTLDATTASTLAQVTVGQGTFAWDGGTIIGSLTDDVLTTLAGTGTRSLAPGALLTNKNVIEVDGGTLAIPATAALVNGGILRLLKDVTVSGAGVLQNGPGVIPTGSTATTAPPAVLAVGGQDDVTGTGTATINGVALHNIDQVDVVAGVHLLLTGSTQSWLHNNSSLTSPQPPTTSGPAVLQVGSGETLALQGVTKLSKGLQLRLDGGADGTTSKLIADLSSGPVSVTATAPSEGTLAWASGTITGPLTASGVYAAITDGGSGSKRLLSTPDTTSSAAPALTFAGNTTAPDSAHTLAPPAAPTELAQGARVLVTGQADLAGPGNGMVKLSGTSGQSLTIASGATLRRRPASSSPSAPAAPTETATIDVPVVNRGTVELDASLNAAGGYLQQLQSGAPSTAARPLTALLGGSWLTSPSAVAVSAGGIGGKGTVHTPKLSMSGAWLGAGYRANCREVTSTFAESCIGVLRVVGALALTSTSDVQVVVRKETVSGKTTIVHDTVAVTGSAALNGTLTTATGSGYTPTYLTAVSHVVTFASRTGTFSRLLSPLAPVGYGWRPSYDDASTGGRGVDVRLVDTGPPVIGFASLPAFTQQNVLEVHYAAHDNQTGVASYDVRWRRAGGLNGAYGAWVEPTSWRHTTARFQVVTGVAEGYTYCVQVRARDKAGNVSPWTAAPCTAREFDDRLLRATGAWARSAGHPHFYDNTYSRTTSAGSTLSKYGTYTRIAVSAYRCPTCGTVKVYSGGTLVKTWDLKSSKTGKVNWVSPVAKLKSARVRLVAVTPHRLVQIDALGLLR